MVRTRSRIFESMKKVRTPRIQRIQRIQRSPCKYGNTCYQKIVDHLQTIHKDVRSMPPYMQCPCGGGQSCLIDRRWLGEWCHEDDVFKRENIPFRKSCMDPYTVEQEIALKRDLHQDSTMFWDNSQLWDNKRQ